MAWKKFSINSTFFNDIFSFDDEHTFHFRLFWLFTKNGNDTGSNIISTFQLFQQLFMIRQTPSKNKSVQQNPLLRGS